MHIPKTSGTSFIFNLYNNYSYNKIHRFDQYPIFDDHIKGIKINEYVWFCGHISNYHINELFGEIEDKYTILRSPWEKLISNYEFYKIKKLKSENPLIYNSNFSFEEYIECKIPELLFAHQSSYIRWFHKKNNLLDSDNYFSYDPSYVEDCLDSALDEAIKFNVIIQESVNINNITYQKLFENYLPININKNNYINQINADLYRSEYLFDLIFYRIIAKKNKNEFLINNKNIINNFELGTIYNNKELKAVNKFVEYSLVDNIGWTESSFSLLFNAEISNLQISISLHIGCSIDLLRVYVNNELTNFTFRAIDKFETSITFSVIPSKYDINLINLVLDDRVAVEYRHVHKTRLLGIREITIHV